MAWLNRGTDALYRMSQPVGGWRDVGGGVLVAYAAYRKFTTTSTCDLFGTITPGSSNYFSYFRQSALKLETQIKTTTVGRWAVGNGAPPAGRWQILVCVMRYSGAEMWIANTADGSISNGTGTYFRNPTDPPSCMYVGESPAGDGGQDFEIAVPTFWHGEFADSDVERLLRGVHPLDVQPERIALHLPLDGSRRELVTGVPMVGLNMAGTTFTDDPAFLRGLRTVVFFPGVQVPLYRRGSQPLGQVAVAAGAISGTAAGTSTASGSLKGAGSLSGTSPGAASASGAAVGTGALAGSSAGAGTATGTLTASGALSAAAAGAATVTGALEGAGALAGGAAGTSTATGALVNLTAGAISGSAAGSSTATGALSGAGSVAGAAAGSSTVTATLAGSGALSGAAAGAASATGTLIDLGAASDIPGRLDVRVANRLEVRLAHRLDVRVAHELDVRRVN